MTYEDGFRDGHSCCAKHAENLQALLTEALERVKELEECLELCNGKLNKAGIRCTLAEAALAKKEKPNE